MVARPIDFGAAGQDRRRVDHHAVGEIEPRNFSFNTPHGACPECTGLGFKMQLDEDLVAGARAAVRACPRLALRIVE